MRRVDLRHLKGEFLVKMKQEIDRTHRDEVVVFLFEIGDFSAVESAINLVKESECELMNSLKFNQVDWTIIIKKV
ncbi:hypothetical protein KDD93_01390 [Campylobacter sp. faydin G-24]|uniref:NADH-ubiquinone oxidoreductase chain E n=1 Tax=Campylobacter anatolicus TaxID=2829105 RepID=A0ABS5HG20_9BACT|nr:NADH-ubiquinone oxidoreductase subunit E family protein [Campylobacter anatolicus]MBR8462318.1 hypothetical protein [Campylobacter anatolicus]MBR8463229.1 hypothetical protein [Campylobacter anatolicus]